MTNRLHTFLSSHLAAPLDAVYARMDEGQLDGTRRPVATASVATAPSAGSHRVRLHHVTH